MTIKHYDVIVVGSGMAGLTSAAYLCKEGHSVLVLEKDTSFGGLLGGFEFSGHTVDKGARGIIDSGIIFPMLRQLGLRIEFFDNPIKITVHDQSITLKEATDIQKYGDMLKTLFPDHQQDIDRIISDIYRVMDYMDVLYGIENPLFLPKPYDIKYVSKTLLPWMFRFMKKMRKAMKLMEPINDHLRKITNNEALIQIISQHFFDQTPTFFALSYFTLYQQYHYPKGSTQTIIDAMIDLIQKHRGELLTQKEVIAIDPTSKTIITHDQTSYTYDQLIWAADTNHLYQAIDQNSILSPSLLKEIQMKKDFYKTKKGADSIITSYLIIDHPLERFALPFGPHCFYTRHKEGLSIVDIKEVKTEHGFVEDKEKIFDWIKRFIAYNTLEISIPGLRDPALSPANETSLIVSTLFDHDLTKHIKRLGLYDRLKDLVKDVMIEQLSHGLPFDLKNSVKASLVATPLTISSLTNSTDGSVTGWSFANDPFPAEYRFLRVSKSVLTPIASIKQAGQWAFNPAGVPVAVLTGKLAADAVEKDLKKKR